MNLSPGIDGLADLNEHPIFSPQRFDLQTLGDAALQRQLMESFLRQNPATRANLISAAHAGHEQFGDAIHQLKGICHFTAAERMLRILRFVQTSESLKDESYRIRAAEIMLEGLDQLEKTLLRVLSERDGR